MKAHSVCCDPRLSFFPARYSGCARRLTAEVLEDRRMLSIGWELPLIWGQETGQVAGNAAEQVGKIIPESDPASAALPPAKSGAKSSQWKVYEKLSMAQDDPLLQEVMPGEDMDDHDITWHPGTSLEGGVWFGPSGNPGSPLPEDELCWLLDSPREAIWWQGVFEAPSTSVQIQLDATDANDGWVDVFVDDSLAFSYYSRHETHTDVMIVGTGLPEAVHAVRIQTRPGGGDVSLDYVAQPAAIKWDQPPVFADRDDLYYGLGEVSYYHGNQIVADDFVCTTDDPITYITWWGSEPSEPSTAQLDAFHLGIWTDEPADQGDPGSWSRPLELVWESVFPWPGTLWDSSRSEYVGWNFDPVSETYKECMQFQYVVPENQWFYPDLQSGDQVYWLSVSAVYSGGGEVTNPFRWMGRPRSPYSAAPDTAVRIFAPTAPATGSNFTSGEPVEWPTPGESWDMAFELRSRSLTPTVLWDQQPELEDTGVDVNATQILPTLLLSDADDFQPTTTALVTEIEVIGTWYNDSPPFGDPEATGFDVRVYADGGPLCPPYDYHRPWGTIWISQGAFEVELTAAGLQHGWLNPPNDYLPAIDTTCYTYRFTPDAPFLQTGTAERPGLYWLGVSAKPMDLSNFGWMTSSDHRGYTAAWWDMPVGIGQLFYPSGHPQEGQPMDLAFRLIGEHLTPKWLQTPQPYTPPDLYEGLGTQSTYDYQVIVADDFVCDSADPLAGVRWWGGFENWNETTPPWEHMPDGFQLAVWTDVPAEGEESFGHPGQVIWQSYCDDYTVYFDGWQLDPRPPLVIGDRPVPLPMFRFECRLLEQERFFQEGGQNIYWLSISADYDGPGKMPYPWTWLTQMRDPLSPASDDAVLILDPLDPVLGSRYVRGYPVFTEQCAYDTAFVLFSGEGDDQREDFGDAPEALGYPTRLESNGARHRIEDTLYLGSVVDPDRNGQPDSDALGDDNDGIDDEDGVTLPSVWIVGQPLEVDVEASAEGYLDAWLDLDQDGSWEQPEDQVFQAQPLAAGLNVLSFTVPQTAKAGRTYMRFRFSSAGGLSSSGPADDGEIEDYLVIMPSGGISGTKWDDLNGDGRRDPEEPGLAGWRIFLDHNRNGRYDLGEREVITDSQGGYVIADLVPGTYTVAEQRQNGWAQIYPDGGTHTVTVVSGQTTPQIDFGNRRSSDVTGRLIFYNNSAWDSVVREISGCYVFYNGTIWDWDLSADSNGNRLYDPGEDGPNDDLAIAPDKRALWPDQTASYANFTSYYHGITGIMVDVFQLPGTPTVDDFEFRVGNTLDPGTWDTAPDPAAVTVRPGEGTDGSDRTTIIWEDDDIVGCWLQVTMLPTARTGLADPDIFYFGNLPGETGNPTSPALVDAEDMTDTQSHIGLELPIDSPYDHNRNGRGDPADVLIVRDNMTFGLPLIAPPPADHNDGAIASDKYALMPGQTATFANYTSYGLGINGLMVDIYDRPPGAELNAADFQFRVGNNDDPGGWLSAPTPSSITVRSGNGILGSDRITLTWPDHTIQNTWLQVAVLATANTGLAESDVFYFGNVIGETGNSITDARVNVVDALLARNNPRTFINPAPIDFPYDFSRDQRVNATDMLIARNNQTHSLNALKLITVPAGKTAVRLEVSAAFAEQADGALQWLYELEDVATEQRASDEVLQDVVDLLLAGA